MKLIAPSLLSANFAKLGEEMQMLEKAGANLFHIDVMDGHFVPNLTMGPPVVTSIRKITKLPLDCHLMIENPLNFIEAFQKAGADWISVHIEACDLNEVLPKIKSLGAKSGAVLNPDTPIEDIFPFCSVVDYILIMTVHPGFSGQKILEGGEEKIRKLKNFIQKEKLKTLIQVDGGIKLSNIAPFAKAGADIFVSGSGILATNDYSKTISQMKEAISIRETR